MSSSAENMRWLVKGVSAVTQLRAGTNELVTFDSFIEYHEGVKIQINDKCDIIIYDRQYDEKGVCQQFYFHCWMKKGGKVGSHRHDYIEEFELSTGKIMDLLTDTVIDPDNPFTFHSGVSHEMMCMENAFMTIKAVRV